MTQYLLPIGRFAQLCRLSIKQLRHYDELGLLRPAKVDPSSGYRYYAPEQARAALAIGLLRTLEVPLPAIAQVLTGDAATVNRVLGAEHDRLRGELDRRRATLLPHRTGQAQDDHPLPRGRGLSTGPEYPVTRLRTEPSGPA